jgi:acyl-CoA thioester hydrolase
MKISTELTDYPVILTWPVQWGDQDVYQHVNNTVYFRWFESARIAYGDRIGLLELMRTQRIGLIMASITCDYRLPLTYPDDVQIGARIARIGRTSMTMDHLLVSVAAGAIAAEGTSTLVVYDYNASRPHPMPDSLRAAIEAMEGRKL